MLTQIPSPPAMVQKAEQSRPHLVPRHEDPQVAALQGRAEAVVEAYTDHEVEMYELERAFARANEQLPPVPVTDRGLRVLAAKRYAVDANGYLTLG